MCTLYVLSVQFSDKFGPVGGKKVYHFLLKGFFCGKGQTLADHLPDKFTVPVTLFSDTFYIRQQIIRLSA
jgi:hypothetical protein